MGSSGSETIAPGSDVRRGSTRVTVPGMGSLSVTGPTGEERDGARSDNRLIKVVSEKLRPLSSGEGREVQRSIGEDVLAPSQPVSGNESSRRGVIATTQFSGTHDPLPPASAPSDYGEHHQVQTGSRNSTSNRKYL